MVILKVRWQVELVFKFWKSCIGVDKSRSHNPYRILCEVYAKLLTALITHRILIVGKWNYLKNSLFKAGKVIPKMAMQLLDASNDISKFNEVLSRIEQMIKAGSKINKRKKSPSTIQRLNVLSIKASII